MSSCRRRTARCSRTNASAWPSPWRGATRPTPSGCGMSCATPSGSKVSGSKGTSSRGCTQRARRGWFRAGAGWLVSGGDEVGRLGEVDPGVLEAYEIDGRVGWLDLDLEGLLDPEKT